MEDVEVERILGHIPGKANHYRVSRALTGKGRFFKDSEICNYEKSFISQCRIYRGRLIDGPFKLSVRVFFVRSNCDLDNSLKTLLDCLQMAKAITNDNLCYKIVAEKKVDASNPRIEFCIQEFNEQKRLF